MIGTALLCVSSSGRGHTHTVPLPLGRPRAFTVGLAGDDGSTEDRKLEAGDGGTEENGEDVSERAGDSEAGGGGGGGGGGGSGKSWAEPGGEDKLLEAKKGGGGGGKEGEPGESRLPALGNCGTLTLPKGLWAAGGDIGEERLEPEEPDDWVT